MFTKSKLNKYAQLKRKVRSVLCDLSFLRACKRLNVTPSFVKIKAAVKNNRSDIAVNKAKRTWLNCEIKHKYKELAQTELSVYSLHLEITKGLNDFEFIEWISFDNKVQNDIEKLFKQKTLTHNRKLNNLIEATRKIEPKLPQFIPDFIHNESSVSFSEDELNLLNKGLKFTPKPPHMPLLDTVVDIETCLKFKVPSIQHDIRTTASAIIDLSKQSYKVTSTSKKQIDTIKNLKEKDVVYVKADKGNKIVILDKNDYKERVNNLIINCKYQKVTKNPLPKMIRDSDVLRKRISENFGSRLSRSLIVSNPKLAYLYALPKIHKSGKQMRPIVDNINTPCYKQAKWLVQEIKKLPPLKSYSVKNSFEFVQKIKNVKINENEIMISFDVCSLFPSIPVDLALIEFKKHLDETEVSTDKKIIYQQTAQLCMDQSFFQFDGEIFKVTKGTNMGNPLSPLIAELFMSSFEVNLSNQSLLPRVWWRYVDDVFAIIRKEDISKTLELLNSQNSSIQFTCEEEENGKLPFLDLELQRFGEKIEIGIYHKPSSTMRTITMDSHTPIQHKKAAYHSLIHRLCNLPLSLVNFKSEYEYIKNVASVNGYSEKMIDELIFYHSHKARNSNLTTLYSQQEKVKNQRVSMSFVPEITNKLKKKFNEHGFDIVYKNNNKLCNYLGSTKDKTNDLDKSGIYAVKCNDCGKEYFGQTKRSIKKRFNDHLACIRLNQPSRSAVAAHVIKETHNVSVDNVRVLKQVRNEMQLDAYESFYIQKGNNLLNQDNGNIESCLFAKI